MVALRSGPSPGRIAPSLVSRFMQMVPEIRQHARCALRGVESRRLEPLVTRVVSDAFAIFSRLAERGLADLAYPKPLAMAAVARLRSDGFGRVGD